MPGNPCASRLIGCGTTSKDTVSLDTMEVGSNEGVDARVVLTGQSHSSAQTGRAHNLDPVIIQFTRLNKQDNGICQLQPNDE